MVAVCSASEVANLRAQVAQQELIAEMILVLRQREQNMVIMQERAREIERRRAPLPGDESPRFSFHYGSRYWRAIAPRRAANVF
jgi:hypothetical protein